MTMLEWVGLLYGAQLIARVLIPRCVRQHRAEQVWLNARRWSNN